MIKDQRMYTVFALMLASFLAAIDVAIVDTAMPRIVGALGGFSMFTWLITAYMLTSTSTVPVYGKLADIIGRKLTFTIGATIFVLGSALCGLSQTMTQLILFRAVQGLGAGAILPTVQTIIGDIFTPAERAKYQGWFSAVWGFSSLIGPLAGGLIVDYATWRWLFYVNLPLGIIALLMIWRFLDEKVERKKVAVDYIGAVTLTSGISAVLLLLQLGGSTYAWGSPQIIGLGAAALALLATFVWQEGRAPNPMLPLDLFKNPQIRIPVLAGFMVGGVMYGVTVYLPIWAQGVQGFTATRSGASLLWMSIAWSLSSFVGGRLILKMGVRPAALTGMVLLTTAAGSLVVLGRTMDRLPEVVLGMLTFVVGSGMGFSTLSFVLGIQNAVDWARRGVATASLQFMRTLGGMIWVALMGAVMNVTLMKGLQQVPGVVAKTAAQAGEVANALVDPEAWKNMPPEQLELMREALASGLRNVHLVMLFAGIIALLVTLTLPNVKFEKKPAAR